MAFLRGGILTVLFAVAFVPLIVADGLFFPYVTGKALAFRVLVDIAVVLWIALYFSGGVRAKGSIGAMVVASFVGVVCIANLFGVHPWYSMTSNFERMEGFVLLMHAALFFYIATTIFSKTQWRAWWFTLVGVAAVAAYIAIGQAVTGIARPGSVFGNPIYLAGFELFCFGIAALLYGEARERRTRVLLIAAMVLAAVTIYVSGTRGALIGLVGAMSTSVFVVAMSNARMRWWAVGGLFALLLSISGGWLLLQQYTFTPGTPLARIANISISDTTVQSRLLLAEMAWKGLRERPLLGYGQEGFTAVFAQQYTEELFTYESWYDRAHNVFIDWFVMAGIAGGVLFIVLVGMLFWYAVYRWQGYERAILVGLLVGYVVYLATVFHDVTSYILLFGLLAFLQQDTANVASSQKVTNAQEARLTPVAFLIGGLFAFMVNAPSFHAAANILSGVIGTQYIVLAAESKNVAATTAWSTRTRSAFVSVVGAGRREMNEQRAIAAIKIAQLATVPVAEKRAWYTAAIEGVAENSTAFPHDPRQFMLLGDVHAVFGNTDAALEAYTLAQERAPRKQTIMVARARVLANSGNIAEAITLIDAVLETNFRGAAARKELELMRVKLVSAQAVL